MTDKPRNKWFRGDGTAKRMDVMSDSIILRRDGEGILVDDRVGFWHTEREYVIVPLADLTLDIEEPEPELVKVEGCTAPTVQESSAIPGWTVSALYGDRGVRVLLVFHPDKNAAIEAHNAAAEVLNKHGGV